MKRFDRSDHVHVPIVCGFLASSQSIYGCDDQPTMSMISA